MLKRWFVCIFVLAAAIPALAGDVSDDSLNVSIRDKYAPIYMHMLRETGNVIKDFLTDRISVGVRNEKFKLKTEKDDFVGSIDKLDAKQNYDPRLFVDMLIINYLDIDWEAEITWTRIVMDTITTYGSNGYNQNDGALKLSGPVFMLNGSYTNESRYTPYAGLGMVYFKNTDVSEGWWHYGFNPRDGDWRNAEQDYIEWRRSGSHPWPNGGFTRTFKLDKTWGYAYNIGLRIRISENFQADLNIRYTDAVVDNTYTMAFYGEAVDIRFSEFDVSHYTYAAGIKYEF